MRIAIQSSFSACQLQVSFNAKMRMFKYFTILALFYFAGTTAFDEHDDQIVKDFIKGKCQRNGGDNALEELKRGKEDFHRCVFENFRWLSTFEETLKKMCIDQRPALYSCLNIVLDKLEPCLDPEEKYFPNFISSWYNFTLDSHCKDDGHIIIEHMEEYNVISSYSNCTSIRSKMGDKYEKCFSKTEVLEDLKNPSFVIPKRGLCSYLKHGNDCVVEVVRIHCDDRLADFIERHLEPTKLWCDKYVNNAAHS